MRAAFRKLRKKGSSHERDALNPHESLSAEPQSSLFTTRRRQLSAPSSPDLKVRTRPASPVPRPPPKTVKSAPPETPTSPKKTPHVGPRAGAPPPYALVLEYDGSSVASPNPAFLEAIKRHEARLSDDELADFKSPMDVLMNAKVLDEMHHTKSDSRRFGARVEKILKGMNQYMGVVQICVQHNPEVSSLVVGGIMFILNLGIQFVEFFDKLTRIIEKIERHLSYLSIYATRVFHKSEAVQEALARTYEDLLNFCRQTRRVFMGSDGRTARQTSFRIFLRNIWDPFEVTFSSIEKRFLDNAALVIAEAQAQEILDANLHREEERYREALKVREAADEKRAAVLASLNANDYEENHRQMFAKRHGKSGCWLIESEEYQGWVSNAERMLLWCYGNPGVGKTILASLVIEDLTQRFPVSQETGVVFAYASYKDIESSQDPKRYLSTFILQLSRQREGLIPEVEAFYNANRKDARDPTFATFGDLFCQVLRHFKAVYIVLDALDEVAKRTEFLQFLTALVPNKDESKTGDCIVKIFVTSRREGDIENRFSEAPNIQIRATKVAADIDAYICDELDKRLENGELQISGIDGLKEKVFETLSQRADGMFLWVVYQLDHICHQSMLEGHQGVEEALDTLPETMDETYARVLVKIDRQRGTAPKLARKILLWVSFARVPLSLEQLATAIAIEQHHKRFSDLRIMPQPKVILEITGNLLTVNDFGQVQFFHYSAKEFLIRDDTERPRDLTDEEWSVVQRYRISEDEAHLHMFKACFDFLTFPEFESSVDSRIGYIDWLKQSIFVGYAARWWNHHIEAVTKDLQAVPDDVKERLEKLLVPGGKALYVITNAYLNIRAKFTNGWSLNNETAAFLTFSGPEFLALLLHLQNTFSLFKASNHPLLCNRTIEQIVVPDKDYRTLIRWACRQFSTLYLYESFLNDPFFPHNLSTNLRIASSIRRRSFVELLLSMGADPNMPDTQGKLPLSAVAAKRDTRGADGLEIMKMLVDKGANPNLIDARHGPALLPAVRIAVEHPSYTHGTKMPTFLLDHGADPNITSQHGTPLAEACAVAARSPISDNSITHDLVTLLLSRGANVNLYCSVNGSSLMAAASAAAAAVPGCSTRGIKLTELLLLHGADPNLPPQPPEIGTILATTVHAACSRGFRGGPGVAVISLLLSRGADINALCPRFGSALIVAAASVSERRRGPGLDILKLLLDSGADPNLVHPEFGTAIGQAALVAAKTQGKRVKAVTILLDAGAKMDVEGGGGGGRGVLECVREAARENDTEKWRENYVLKLVERRRNAAKEESNISAESGTTLESAVDDKTEKDWWEEEAGSKKEVEIRT